MPSGKCKGCDRITNSATSNWWFTKDHTPTECYMAFENDVPVKGCAFDKADPHMKKWILNIIEENPWKQPRKIILEVK